MLMVLTSFCFVACDRTYAVVFYFLILELLKIPTQKPNKIRNPKWRVLDYWLVYNILSTRAIYDPYKEKERVFFLVSSYSQFSEANLILNGVTDSEIWLGNYVIGMSEWYREKNTSSIHIHKLRCAYRRLISRWWYVCCSRDMHSKALSGFTIHKWNTWNVEKNAYKLISRFFFACCVFFLIFCLGTEFLVCECMLYVWIMAFDFVWLLEYHWPSDGTKKFKNRLLKKI